MVTTDIEQRVHNKTTTTTFGMPHTVAPNESFFDRRLSCHATEYVLFLRTTNYPAAIAERSLGVKMFSGLVVQQKVTLNGVKPFCCLVVIVCFVFTVGLCMQIIFGLDLLCALGLIGHTHTRKVQCWFQLGSFLQEREKRKEIGSNRDKKKHKHTQPRTYDVV